MSLDLEGFLHKLVHHSSAPENVKAQMHDEIDGKEPEAEPAKFDPDTGEPLNDAARARVQNRQGTVADPTPVPAVTDAPEGETPSA